VDDSQLVRYSRHILLDEIGIEAQTKLLNATALIIGAGGLGSPAALYLASAGVGTIIIADGDTVDATNLQRQIMHTEARVGHAKVSSGAQAMAAINSGIKVITINTRLQGQALLDAVGRANVVLDCSDNFATRHAINRACVEKKVPLVSGAAIQFEGQLAVFDSRQPDSPCYHCLFPQSGHAPDALCATMGVFAPLTGIIGTMQAAQALKILGGFGDANVGQLMMLDTLSLSWQTLKVKRDLECAVCAGSG
jgi:molybdopterin-synthase adenylyltransferase